MIVLKYKKIYTLMKYFKTYYELITEKQLTNKILYHGSLYAFENFKNTTTFFSETESFAENYAVEKSQDAELDREPILYKVKFSGNILDVNDPIDYKKLEDALPEKIEFQWNNFGFTTELEKSEIMFRMTGFFRDDPYEPILNCKIGDEIPEPTYPIDKWIVYKIDDDNVYTYSKKEFNYLLSDIFPAESYIIGVKQKVRDLYKPINDYVRDYISTVIEKKYVSQHDIKLYSFIFFNSESSKRYSDAYDIKIPKKNFKEFDDLYQKTKSELEKYIIEETYIKKFNRKSEKVKLNDTWRYFENETVHTAIVNLGYDGYLAKEKKILTYAIFKPTETVKILTSDGTIF